MIVKEEKIVKKNTRKARNTHLVFCISLFFYLKKRSTKNQKIPNKKYPGTDFIGVGAEVRFQSEVLTFSPRCRTHTCRPYKTKATERSRTADLGFTKPLLYQLSYGGEKAVISGQVSVISYSSYVISHTSFSRSACFQSLRLLFFLLDYL